MAQGFDYTEPVNGSPLQSSPVRTNFQALATQHRGNSAPSNPEEGYQWLDDSDANNWKLKKYVNTPGVGLQWVTLMVHVESIPIVGTTDTAAEYHLEFYEGDNPPAMVNVDDYNFEDAAAFDPSTDQDVIFRLEPEARYDLGAKLRMRYCMSTSDAGVLKLQLDYRVKAQGDPVSGGTNYSQTFVIDPVNTADTVAYNEEINIPSGRIDETTQVVHCRLTRLGSDAQDTHTGIFCLFGIEPKVA